MAIQSNVNVLISLITIGWICMYGWMNEWTNEWVNEEWTEHLAIQSTNVNVLISLITNGWICMYGWMNEWTNESEWRMKRTWLSKVQT